MNLLVKIKLVGETRYRVRATTRMKLGGDGVLMLFDVTGGAPETISMRDVESIAIHQVVGSREAAA